MPGCADGATVREFDLSAINVEVTLNRFLDYDPQGRMYALTDEVGRIRAEEQQNRIARAGSGEPAVSVGLQGDAIQPLVMRANQGDCVRITLRNDLVGEPVNLVIPDSGLVLAGTSQWVSATNTEAIAKPGSSVQLEWSIALDHEPGSHVFYSTVNERLQRGHGLFGAFIVEPRGSQHLDPFTIQPGVKGWAAVIVTPDGEAFREFVPIYHEIGDETFEPLDRDGRLLPQVDELSTAYRPGGRALNYRSEPFMNRMKLLQGQSGITDLSLAYSSYSFGDPATPVARAYLGDPTTMRLIDGGAEVFHVHHLHGGSVRWLREPGTEDTRSDVGLDKQPPISTEVTTRIDSQTLGPGTAYDAVSECGAGGCQQGAGDFLYHCHVAHHYLAGMWGIFRVYNTLQDGEASTDTLPSLPALPGNGAKVSAAVTSEQLVGKTVNWNGAPIAVTSENLSDIVEGQLPPAGEPGEYDASVFDWAKQGALYLNEAETAESWANYAPRQPGVRLSILFDPVTGRLAYPLLSPHLGTRPPFAANHGPSPYLDPPDAGGDSGQPWPGGVCPIDLTKRQFNIEAISVPIVLNQREGIVDPDGQLFVLKQDKTRVMEDPDLRTPLVLRANAGEDCIDIVMTSDVQPLPGDRTVAKSDLHVHFVQFDVQGSDGVNAGFNYEQTIVPYRKSGTGLAEAGGQGDTSIVLSDASKFQPGALIGVGMDQDGAFEIHRIASIVRNTIELERPLAGPVPAGSIVSTEFIRYRWYPDAQVGTTYFHDHVHATTSWRHGLVGALVVEPPGSTYHDPVTGEAVISGPIADIRTTSRVSAEISGSFREMVVLVQDDHPVTSVGKSTGSAINLRVEPLASRGGDAASVFSSAMFGDPETPMLQAYAGDPLVIRSLVTGTNDVHTLHTGGHSFRLEAMSNVSQPGTSVPIGISERFDLSIASAGGPSKLPGDYIYYNGRYYKLQEGSWGIIRVLPPNETAGLQRLPGVILPTAADRAICPVGAPNKDFDIAAVHAPLPMLSGELGRVFTIEKDAEAVQAGTIPVSPLVLHANIGNCIKITLRNGLDSGRVSLHVDRLSFDPADSQGIAIGRMPDQSVAPGAERLYTFYASADTGEGAALLSDWGDPVNNRASGLYGAIIIGPPGASYTDPGTGEDVSESSAWAVDVQVPDGESYRDFALFMHDQDPIIGTQVMPYALRAAGTLGINYRLEPLAKRLLADPDPSTLFSCAIRGDPATPLMAAYVGDQLRVHILTPVSEQAQVFSIEAHDAPLEPAIPGTDRLGTFPVGSGVALDLNITTGAGGNLGLSGDYVYANHRGAYLEAGMWGILRVLDRQNPQASLRVLAEVETETDGPDPLRRTKSLIGDLPAKEGAAWRGKGQTPKRILATPRQVASGMAT